MTDSLPDSNDDSQPWRDPSATALVEIRNVVKRFGQRRKSERLSRLSPA